VKVLRRRDRSVHDRILAHYRAVWPGRHLVDMHFGTGPVGTRLPDFHIVKIAPDQPGGMWTFATIGTWRATATESHGLEFVAVAKSESASIFLHIAMTAFYHAGPTENRLGVGHTVSIGQGWVEGSPLDAILVGRPYLWGPALEHCDLGDRHVQILWLVPIHESERAFAKTHGLDALEERFETTSVDYLDPFRPAVA
jgi:hypothetical protein